MKNGLFSTLLACLFVLLACQLTRKQNDTLCIFLMGCFFCVTAIKRAIQILIDFLLHNIIIIGTPLQT